MKLLTRSGLDWTAKFGKDLAAAFKALPVGTALIDGELVVENQNGASDFSLLQADLSEGRSRPLRLLRLRPACTSTATICARRRWSRARRR